ncbi:MAG: ankyrin repeat domain-containing protein [Gammaproteobacteria bacterium]|nr:ankyrin repeat domain-containing protein [Gammaproteobacteria bacterium]
MFRGIQKPVDYIELGRQHEENANFEKAKDSYSEALKKEETKAEALCRLGTLYVSKVASKAKEYDFETALQYFMEAAAKKHSEAQYNLGHCYTATDRHEEAFANFKLSAEQDNESAQYVLARRYLRGLGVQRNFEQAIHWYTKSAEKGLEKARNELNLYILKNNLYLQAAKEGDLEKLRWLQKNSHIILNPTYRDENENTALHLAVSANVSEDVMAYLVEEAPAFTISPNSVDKENQTPLEIAVSKNNFNGVKYLAGRTKIDFYVVIQQAMAKKASCEIIDLLYERLVAEAGHLPPLHLAASAGHIAYIQHLKAKQVDINSLDQNGQFAIDYAITNNRLKTAQTLMVLGSSISHGKNLLLQNPGLTPEMRVFVQDATVKAELDALESKKDREQLTEKVYSMIFEANESKEFVSAAKKLMLAVFNDKKLAFKEENDVYIFSQFLKAKLFSKNSDDIKVLVKKLSTKVSSQEKFSAALREGIAAYKKSCEEGEAVIDGIIFSVISSLNLKADFNEEALSELLKEMMLVYSKNNPDILHLNHKAISELIHLIVISLNYSVAENLQYHLPIYKIRIHAAFDEWLYKQDKLKDNEKEAYALAVEVVDKLNQAEPSKMKVKKMGIAKSRLKKVFFENPPLLQKIRDNVESMSKFVTHLVGGLQEESLKDYSIDTAVQVKYETKILKLNEEWLVAGIHALSVGRNFRLFGNGANQEIKAAPADKKSPFEINKKVFIDSFIDRFDLLFGKFRSLDAGEVRRNEETIDKWGKKIEEYRDKIPSFKFNGSEVPSSFLVQMFIGFGIYLKNESVAKSARRMTKLFELHNAKERLEIIERAAEFFVERHKWQFERMDAKGAEIFAKAAANRAVQHITYCDENSIEDGPGILNRIYSLFYPKQPSKILEFKGPLAVLITGVLEQKAEETDNDKVYEYPHEGEACIWTPVMILNNTGIIAKDKLGNHKRFVHQHTVLGCGYRFGTEVEAYENDYKAIADEEHVNALKI